jgi:8-amino-7-oxononanoate synthase
LQTERDYLRTQSARLRTALREQGWHCGASTTQIIPVLLGNEQAAMALAGALREKNILVPAIRPPTVPRGSSRLRLSLSCAHKPQDVDQLIAVMRGHTAAFGAPKALVS